MKRIAMILILVGIVVLATPYVGSKIIQKIQADMFSLLAKQREEILLPDSESYDNSQTTEEQPLNKDNEDVLGIISIPYIDVELPIVRGVGEDSLRKGIGYMEESDPFGTLGNAVLAGHRSYTFGKMFNRLDELKIGDKIMITSGNEILTYSIFLKLVVLPQDLSVLEDVEGKSILTLITCTPIRESTHRLIVQAALITTSQILD